MGLRNIVAGASSAIRNLSTKAQTAVIAGITAVVASSASAQAVTPTLDPIVWPIDLASIATSVATAGATMVGLWAIYKIGFRLVRKFISRMGSAI